MVFRFTPDQIGQIETLKNPGSYHQAYRLVAEWAEDGEGVDSGSIIWFRGAADVNEGVGPFSEFIRSYTAQQHVTRYGEPLAAGAVQEASDAIAEKVLQDIIDRHNSDPEAVGVPSLEAIAEDDATGASEKNFNGDEAIWSGNILFLNLGYDDAFFDNLIDDEPGSTYDLLAAVTASYYALGQMSEWVSTIPAIIEAITGNEEGFLGTVGTILGAIAGARDFLAEAYGGGNHVLEATASNAIILGTINAGDELVGTAESELVHGEA